MIEHIITTNSGRGKQLKCLHCGKFSRLRLRVGKLNYAKELAEFQRTHEQCRPKIDGRSLRPNRHKPIICLVCGLGIARNEAKVPFYQDDKLKPFYAHPECAGERIHFCVIRNDNTDWLYFYDTSKVTDYHVGHHNIIVQSGGGWLYFWKGACGEVGSRKEAELQLMFLSAFLIDELIGLDVHLDELQRLRDLLDKEVE